MNREQMKGVALLIFIPIFLLFVGVSFCTPDTKAQEQYEDPFREQNPFSGMTQDDFSQAKAMTDEMLKDAFIATLMSAIMVGTQGAALNERYGQKASDILSRYVPDDSEMWKELEDLKHETSAISADMHNITIETLMVGDRDRDAATDLLNDTIRQFSSSIRLYRLIADKVYEESLGPLTPDSGALIIPELEPGR